MSGNDSLALWRERVDGQTIGSGQCFALMADYFQNVIGCPVFSASMNTDHPNYAIGVWDGYAVNGAAQYFDQVNALEPARAGDVAFWHYDNFPFSPLSHVAIVLGDQVINLDCESQNSPEPVARRQSLTKVGLAGYFRPRQAGFGGDAAATLASQQSPSTSSGVLGTAGQLAAHLSDPVFWKRAGLFALGALLAVFVLLRLLAPQILPKGLQP